VVISTVAGTPPGFFELMLLSAPFGVNVPVPLTILIAQVVVTVPVNVTLLVAAPAGGGSQPPARTVVIRNVDLTFDIVRA
jgi:hypothetical protein